MSYWYFSEQIEPSNPEYFRAYSDIFMKGMRGNVPPGIFFEILVVLCDGI